MPITLGSNITSLRGQRQLAKTSQELGTVFERLSSGQRINKASDDAAGLAIADSLNAQSRIFNQGVRNLNDGQSLLSIADSAIANLSDIMIRLEELAVQAANGVYTNKQRKAMDDEAHALSEEFFRISKTTAYNGQRLFTGELQSVTLQAGVGIDAVLSAGVGGAIGTGSFAPAVSYIRPPLFGNTDVALGDLNGDGILDVVEVGSGVSVRFGLGDGTFGSGATFGAADDAALGDLNGDGNLDIVAVNNSLGPTGVYLGRGDGTFSLAFSQAVNHYVYDIALADLNNDGMLDMVNVGHVGFADGYASVSLGRGDGTFGAAVSYLTEGRESNSVVLGDVNGDGLLDLVTAGRSDVNDGFATVRMGNGTGGFGNATSYSTESFLSQDVTLEDINYDGLLDVLSSGSSDAGDGYATVRLGAGAGTFSTPVSYLMQGFRSYAVQAADVNGDGMLDLVAAGRNDSGSASVAVRFGNGTGSFGTSTSFMSNGGSSSFDLALGDVNGDGVLDIVASGYSGVVGDYASTAALIGATTGGVGPLLPFSLKTLADARQALPVFKRKREQLAAQRGEIGAFQSRIDVARNVLEVSSENFRAAESRIRDADIAEESSRLVRLNILQQAASSVLAQANQQPALALELLRG